jgi:hypothetical protein
MILLSGAPLIGINLLPLLAALCYRGPGGFALASALAALFGLLLAPLREKCISRRYRRPYAKIAQKAAGEPVFWGMLIFLLAVYGGICFFGRIPVSLGLAGIVFCGLILGLSIIAESKRGIKMGHIRFVPVRISSFSGGGVVFPRLMAPFALASLVSLLLPLLIFGSGYTTGRASALPEDVPGEVIRPEEYETHAAFQASFSLRPLGGETPERGAYLRYHQGDDGLIGGYSVMEDAGGGETPPFPLGDLMNFLARRQYTPAPANAPRERLPVFGALLLCVPVFLQIGQKHGKKKGLLVYNDKRIAA